MQPRWKIVNQIMTVKRGKQACLAGCNIHERRRRVPSFVCEVSRNRSTLERKDTVSVPCTTSSGSREKAAHRYASTTRPTVILVLSMQYFPLPLLPGSYRNLSFRFGDPLCRVNLYCGIRSLSDGKVVWLRFGYSVRVLICREEEGHPPK